MKERKCSELGLLLFDLCGVFFLGAECYPTCIMAVDLDLHDPAVLPNGTTVKSLKHWMVPKKVQVRYL